MYKFRTFNIQQVLPIQTELISKLLGNRVAASACVTIEPRRRKFHKPITLTLPLPKAAQSSMMNEYRTSGEAKKPTLRLLCSLAGKRKFISCFLTFLFIAW